MKKNNFTLELIKTVLLFIFVLLFFINILQINNIEQRLINNASRMETLDDTTKEFRASLDNLSSMLEGGGGMSPDGKPQEETRQWLHPEVENFLVKEDDFVLTPPEAKTDGTLIRYYGTNPKSMNPITVSDASFTDAVEAYCQDGFADRHRGNPDLWKPVLAERIEITDDYKEYTIYLKKGVRWHKPAVDWSDPRYDWLKGIHYLTAKDVKFSVDLILNQQVECAHLRNYYEDLEYCKVIDDYTVVFRWKKKTYNSISFTVGFSSIVPEFLYAYDEDGERFPDETLGLKFNEHWYNDKFIGCGPYEFVSYEPGVAIKLKRNEDYYGEKPAIKEIVWLIYGDTLQSVLKMKSKELDFSSLTATQYREEILDGKPDNPFKNGQINNEQLLYTTYYYIGWNADKALFSDKRVRKAMSHAFNAKEILQNVFLGLGDIVSGPFLTNNPAYNQDIKPVEFDLEKSRELLSEAGWKDIDNDGVLEKEINGETTEFEFSLMLFGRSPEWKTAATIFKEDLLKIGVKMNLQTLDWAIMQKKMEDKEFDAYTGGWASSWESDPYQIWHSSQADLPKSSNKVGFRNKEADKIIEELRVTFDKDKRDELCHKFHALIAEEQPYTFFYIPKVTYTWQKEVKRVIFKKIRPLTDSTPWYVDKPDAESPAI